MSQPNEDTVRLLVAVCDDLLNKVAALTALLISEKQFSDEQVTKARVAAAELENRTLSKYRQMNLGPLASQNLERIIALNARAHQKQE